jgi:hypothetical protein
MALPIIIDSDPSEDVSVPGSVDKSFKVVFEPVYKLAEDCSQTAIFDNFVDVIDDS